MKLSGVDVITPNCGSEGRAVVSPGCNDRRLDRDGVIAMDKIGITPGRDFPEHGTLRLHNFQLVPAYLRNLQSVGVPEANDLTRRNSQASRATVKFFTLFEKRLVSHTNTEERTPASNVV